MGMTFGSLLESVGLLQPVSASLSRAYAQVEKELWISGKERINPEEKHDPWHTSFHASSSPLDDPKPCGRKAIYTLMDVPAGGPFDERSRTVMDAGKDMERQFVLRWWKAGILLSEPPWLAQTLFEDPDVWLAGSADAILRLHRRPVPVEIKGKDTEKVIEMQKGQRYADPEHISQLKTYTALVALVAADCWPELDSVTDGYLLYASRERPWCRAEFRFPLDLEAYDLARRYLQLFQQHFMESVLPPRPKDWRWTEWPCQWCPFKRDVCRPDEKAGVTDLNLSAGVSVAKALDPTYSLDKKREAVLARWA